MSNAPYKRSRTDVENSQIVAALRDKQVDAIVGEGYVAMVRLREAEEALRKVKEQLEQRVRERTAELDEKNVQLRERAEQLCKMSSDLILTEQRERQRLARVLHDHLQQLIAAAKMNIKTIADSTNDPAVLELAREADQLLEESIEASRSLAVDLSPPVFKESVLVSGFQWLVNWMGDKHKLKVVLSCDEGAEIEQDDIRLLVFESVRELLFNAVKHAGVSEATVRASMERDYIRVVVSDNGAGFDPGSLGQGHQQPGFGLFNMQQRIAVFGGRLEITSAPGRGATFTLTLPVQENCSAAKKAAAECNFEQAECESSSKIRVMLAEDHPVVRKGISSLLKRDEGIELVAVAADGQEAVEMARQARPDVILMDYSMPKLGGVDATRLIHAEHPEIRIIGLSMYNETELAEEMKSAGAAAVISKSCAAEKLISEIKAVVATARASAGGANS